MGTKKFTAKLKCIWQILTCKSVTLIAQKRPGTDAVSWSWGTGEIKDMVLIGVMMKKCYNSFLDAVNEAATETGELHTLQELKEAIETLEKE